MGFGNPPTTTAEFKRGRVAYNDAIARAERAEAAEALLTLKLRQAEALLVGTRNLLAELAATLRGGDAPSGMVETAATKDEVAQDFVAAGRTGLQRATTDEWPNHKRVDIAACGCRTSTEVIRCADHQHDNWPAVGGSATPADQPEPTCFAFDIDGEQVRLQGIGHPSPEAAEALTELMHALQREGYTLTPAPADLPLEGEKP